MNHRRTDFQLEHGLPLLAGLLFFSSLAYFPLSAGSLLADLPEIGIPIGVSLGIAAYSDRLLRREYDVERVKRIAVYGWGGAVSASFGIWWFVQQLRYELAIAPLLDEALTVASVGSGLGLFVGAHLIHEYSVEGRTNRDRLLAETVWTNEPGPDPILTAITTHIAEIEGIEPVELEPLYEYVDPDVFTELRARDDSQWQLRFRYGKYEVRVSSHGTVTIYGTTETEGEYRSSAAPDN